LELAPRYVSFQRAAQAARNGTTHRTTRKIGNQEYAILGK